MNKKLFSFAALLVLTFYSCQSSDSQRKNLSNYLDSLYAHHKVMGSFAIATNDKVDYVKSVGFADVENRQPINMNTQFRVGSVTKTFTATLVMKAIEEKKLKLDDKLSMYFPTIINADQITITHLLQHRSGIQNFTDQEEYWNKHTQPISENEMIEWFSRLKSDFTPDSKFQYSNSNYALLGFILQKVYNTSYADLLKKKIADPLKLTLTKVGGMTNSNTNEAFSYTLIEGVYKKEIQADLSFALGAGNIISTPTELLKFMIGLKNGKIISKKNFQLMQNFKDGYGFGLVKVPFLKDSGIGHDGRIDENRSSLLFFADKNIGVCYLTNQANFELNDISSNMVKTAYGMNFEMPDFQEKKVPVDVLQKYEGVYKADNFPLDIKIFVENGKLYGQATGQSSFQLEALSDTEFQFQAAGIKMTFEPSTSIMHFKQGSKSLEFKKQ